MTEALRPWVGPDGQVMRRLELHITYSCPERCVFCSEEHRMQRYRRFGVDRQVAETVLRKHARRGVQAVHFTGGEPTIHPQFIELLELARALGMRTSIGTIGTMLARDDFADRALPLLDEALFSLHGPDAAVHDAVAGRSGSFDTVTAAIRGALRRRPDFRAAVNTVMTRATLPHLADTLRLCDALGVGLVIVSNTTPEGAADDDYDRLAPRLDELAQALPVALGAVQRAIVRVFGVPMCVLGPYAMWSNDLHWDPRVTAEWADAPGAVRFTDFYNWAPDRKRVFVPACDGCSRRGLCTGVYDRYAERFPTDALHPLRG